jgi:hypothetical protein
MRLCSSFFIFVWYHSIINQTEVQSSQIFLIECEIFLHNQIFANTGLVPKTHCFTPRICPKMRSSVSSLNMLYTAESAQFYSAFAPTTISSTLCFWRNCKVCSTFSPKTLKTIQKRTVSKTTLNFALHFRWQCSVMLQALGKNGEW